MTPAQEADYDTYWKLRAENDLLRAKNEYVPKLEAEVRAAWAKCAEIDAERSGKIYAQAEIIRALEQRIEDLEDRLASLDDEALDRDTRA